MTSETNTDTAAPNGDFFRLFSSDDMIVRPTMMKWKKKKTIGFGDGNRKLLTGRRCTYPVRPRSLCRSKIVIRGIGVSCGKRTGKTTKKQGMIKPVNSEIYFLKSPHPSVEKKVTFSNIVVRKYGKTQLDNNPGVSSGPAIAIGGNYTDMDPVSVETFETVRGKRKELEDLRLPEGERIARLIGSGYSPKRILVAISNTRKAQTQRNKTIKNLGKANREEVLENIRSKIKGLVMFGKGGGGNNNLGAVLEAQQKRAAA